MENAWFQQITSIFHVKIGWWKKNWISHSSVLSCLSRALYRSSLQLNAKNNDSRQLKTSSHIFHLHLPYFMFSWAKQSIGYSPHTNSQAAPLIDYSAKSRVSLGLEPQTVHCPSRVNKYKNYSILNCYNDYSFLLVFFAWNGNDVHSSSDIKIP